MAAKQVYKIPYGLNESYADMNISLNTRDGSIGRVFPDIDLVMLNVKPYVTVKQ